ncbi:hypothetical protein [Novipirellula rosea]|uniref:MraY-like glycosyltransferase n=1 Tax=Novipirellula rosea TaxID=1031540 RepID=A0ABP8N6H1_9BACT
MIRFTLLLIASWVVMTTTHEVGHLIGGWLGGGTLQHAELRPWHLPHSHFAPDPHPLLTLWSGPFVGAVVPLLVAIAIGKPSVWFIANFCVLANGVYLAVAWFTGDPFLDTPRLLAAGASPLSIAIYCALTLGWGYPAFRGNCQALFRKKTVKLSQRDISD